MVGLAADTLLAAVFVIAAQAARAAEAPVNVRTAESFAVLADQHRRPHQRRAGLQRHRQVGRSAGRQVGSSATLGSGTTVVGTIMALTSISLQADATGQRSDADRVCDSDHLGHPVTRDVSHGAGHCGDGDAG